MPNVLVRDVETSILEKLKIRATRKGRSLQSEVLTILKDAAAKPEPLSELETARKIRNALKVRNQSDSTIRKSRPASESGTSKKYLSST